MNSATFLTTLLLALTTYFSCTVAALAIDETCPPNCKCENSLLECSGFIPDAVPKTVKEVVLTQIDTAEFVPERFCNVSWDSVVKLVFSNLISTSYYGLYDDVFNCLGHLQSFKFSSNSLNTFSNLTFSGLTNINEFDLSGCQSLFWDDIYKILSVKTNFPKLTHLNISHGNPSVLYLDQDFIDALATRPITQLDLSENTLAVTFTNASRLCTTLKTVLFKDTYTMYENKYFVFGEPCKSIHTVDGSGMRRAVLYFKDLKCLNSTILMTHSKFLSAAEVYYLNRIVTYPSNIDISNCIMQFFVTDSIKEFHFTQNNLPNFDAVLRLNPKIKLLNLSYNRVENLHPDAFTLLPSLNAIDLSNNKLYKMHDFENAFLTLFQHNQNLTRINLSFNKLPILPRNTFVSNTKLQELYLSKNVIHEITFNITHLLDLTILDLSFNLIKAFNETSRRFLDTLYENQAKIQSGKHFRLLLEGNPLSCECSSLEFLQWFMVSPIFAETRHNNSCSLNGQEMPIDETAMNAAKEDCEKSSRKRRTVLLSTLLPITGVSLVMLISVYLYRRRQRRLLWKRYADRVHLVRENNAEFEFPVFLSYCSVDNDFVTKNVLHPLQRRLKTITNTNRDLVCYADRHFVPGCTILSEMVRCLENSSVFIAVVSSDYCASDFCKFEIEQAHLMRKPIILIFKEHVEEGDMNPVTREVFQHFTRVKCVYENSQQRIQPGWKEICDAIIQYM